MAQELLELEGTWEEILAHSSELAGHKVHVTVLPASENGAKLMETETTQVYMKHQGMLDVFDELRRDPLSEKERKILDDFEQFNREHPFSLEWNGDLP